MATIVKTAFGFTFWLKDGQYWYGRARLAHGPFATLTEATQTLLKQRKAKNRDLVTGRSNG